MNASGSVLLDTSIVVAHLRRESELQDRFDHTDSVFLPLVALGELYFGAYRSRARDKVLGQIRDFLQTCILPAPGETTADHYGHIKADLAQAGTPIPENDIWIAAMAKQYGLPLATRDQHFSLIPGLDVLGW